MGIPIPKMLVIWASPVTLTRTLSQIAKVIAEGEAHIIRVLGMGMPKLRGCSYHCDSALRLSLFSDARKFNRISDCRGKTDQL